MWLHTEKEKIQSEVVKATCPNCHFNIEIKAERMVMEYKANTPLDIREKEEMVAWANSFNDVCSNGEKTLCNLKEIKIIRTYAGRYEDIRLKNRSDLSLEREPFSETDKTFTVSELAKIKNAYYKVRDLKWVH